MRVLRDHRHRVYVQHTSTFMAQLLSSVTIARVQEFWNEWEIQLLVLVSFSLQVFLFFSAVFRKRHRSRPLSVLLWLAYLSADSVAVFILGRLTFHNDDPRHQLVLFWAPFLLLHLGGQETITAFSMEDCALWKRHLLNLATQLALAIYVVCKQWRWDRHLVAPMVLMFIFGTIKYAERTRALWRAGSWAPGRRLGTGTGFTTRSPPDEKLVLIFSPQKSREKDFERVMEVANEEFQDVIEFFMDVKVRNSGGHTWIRSEKEAIVEGFRSSESGADWAYKMADINLSLVYDYLYTKFGNLNGLFYRITILVLTSAALLLFFVARPMVEVDHQQLLGSYRYSIVDVTISCILLVGALTLEICSIFMWLRSSYWPYMTAISYLQGRYRRKGAFRCAGRILLSIARHLCPPESRVGWSGKMQQYNMFDERIQKKKPVGWLEQLLRRVGIKKAYTAGHVAVSPEVKDVLLHKLCEVAVKPDSTEQLAFTSFHGDWAAAWAASSSSASTFGRSAQRLVGEGVAQLFVKKSAAQQALVYSRIQKEDLVSSALLWHLVTEVCLVADETPTAGGSNKFRTCSQHLSNYVMYLVVQSKLFLDSHGYSVLGRYRYLLDRVHRECGDDKTKFIQRSSSFSVPLLERVSSELLKSEAGEDRWELIATVWVEMLCYIARNCDSGFHAKQLSGGGEFLTHAKLLVFILGGRSLPQT